MIGDDYKEDELIDMKLSRADYKILKEVLRREEAYNWLTSTLKNYWIWTVAGGVIFFITLYDRFSDGTLIK